MKILLSIALRASTSACASPFCISPPDCNSVAGVVLDIVLGQGANQFSPFLFLVVFDPLLVTLPCGTTRGGRAEVERGRLPNRAMGGNQLPRKDAAGAEKPGRLPQSSFAPKERDSAAILHYPPARRGEGIRRLLLFWRMAPDWCAVSMPQGRTTPGTIKKMGYATVIEQKK